jgi:2-C-methyl-D-erythritol 4-phosphate cytidylyltransferase
LRAATVHAIVAVMRASAIVLAAGSGSRLGVGIPKAFVEFGDSTLLGVSLRTVHAVTGIGEVVIAVPSGMQARARDEAEAAQMEIPVKIVPGGAERQDSVRVALAFTSSAAELVVVHDAARPLASVAMFEACLEHAALSGAAIIAIPVADTLKRVVPNQDLDIILETVRRAGLWQAQTPQAFRRRVLLDAHARAAQGGIIATDDSDLVEQIGVPVAIVAGAPQNLKITTIDDLRLAETVFAIQSRG